MKEAFREEAIGALCSGGAHPQDESPEGWQQLGLPRV
jgi:hypothetical protein